MNKLLLLIISILVVIVFGVGGIGELVSGNIIGIPLLGVLVCYLVILVVVKKHTENKKSKQNKKFTQQKNEKATRGKNINDHYTDFVDYGKKDPVHIDQLVLVFDNMIRQNFPELPKPSFKLNDYLFNKLEIECNNGVPHVDTLQKILIEMEHFLNITMSNQSIIFLEKNKDNISGFISRQFYSLNEITICYDSCYNANNYIAILAHELSHAYQYSKNKSNLFGNLELNEEFTDALTFYLGFSEYFINGKEALKSDKDNIKRITLGYLNKNLFDDLVFSVEKLKKDKAQKDAQSKIYKETLNKIICLKDTYRSYLVTINILIQQLQTNLTLNLDELYTINEFLITFNEKSYEQIFQAFTNLPPNNLESAKYFLELLNKDVTKLLIYYEKVRLISNIKY